MKKILVRLVKNEISRYKKLAVSNSLSAEDRTAIEEHIRELEAILAEAEASEEEQRAEEVLRKMQDATDEKLRALAEKIEDSAKQPDGNKSENYLATEEAKRDFGRTIRNCAKTGSDFNEAWRKHLETKQVSNALSLTPDDISVLYPEVVKSKIHDLWNADTNWLTMLNNTRAKVFGVRYIKEGQDELSARARGHQKGATKTEQGITVQTFKIEAQMVYKMLPIDRITEFYDDGALVDYVIDELYRQFRYEIARCVLVGDGRSISDPDRITSITPVGRTTSDSFVTVAGRDITVSLVEDIVALLENIANKEENEIILALSENDLNVLRKRIYGSGGTVQYASREEVAEQLGVSRIVTTPLLGSANTFTYQVIAFAAGLYATVGDVENPKYETYHDFFKNQDFHRIEAAIGGAPEGLAMGAVLTPAP